MSTLVSTLTLESFETLPVHDRRCIFWTMDPLSMGSLSMGLLSTDSAASFADPEFEKEAWLSMVMLEWGPCGQVAANDGVPVGCALYAPASAVARSSGFPTSPVGADAVLLTSLRQPATDHSDAVRESLMHAVVRDLVNRGVRAIEAFGIRLTDDETESNAAGARVQSCNPTTCMIDTAFLEQSGFEIVAPHHRFPRMRLELDRDHGWKQDVEAALERLIAAAELTVTEADARVPVGAR